MRRDGRQIVILYENGVRTTVSYPKYIMEQRLGRKLEKNETVQHKDGNPLNNEPENLEILPKGKHASIDAKRRRPVSCICIHCGRSFKRNARVVEESARRGAAGPYCSKHCAGKRRQGAALEPQQMPEKEYYNLRDQ